MTTAISLRVTLASGLKLPLSLIHIFLSLCLTAMGATLYDLQINQGEALYERSQNKIAETQIVEADRGDILDRNGRVLVSNRVVYQVTLDLDHMGKEPEERNATLLSLVHAARASGVEWSDTLPISADEPFVFTEQSPYFTLSQNEDGTPSKTLTRLGQLLSLIHIWAVPGFPPGSSVFPPTSGSV